MIKTLTDWNYYARLAGPWKHRNEGSPTVNPAERRGLGFSRLVIFAIGAPLAFAFTALQKVSAADTGTVYNVYEKNFNCVGNCPTSDDARSSQAFVATFRNGSTIIQLPGFWAGGNAWKFRFAPTSTGTWTWDVATTPQVTFSEAATGSVTVNPSGNHGFLKQDSLKPYTLSYSDGTPEYVWGNTAYAILDTALHGDTAGWHTFVDQTRAHGMNKIRMLVTMWDFGDLYPSEKRYPWLNCTVASPQFRAFNQTYWQKLDEIVQYMQSKGVIAELILFPDYGHPTSGDRGLFTMTQPDEQRYMKFAIARYAAYSNVVWCTTNEWGNSWRSRFPEQSAPPGNNSVSGNCLWHPEWITGGSGSGGTEKGLGPYVKENDPYVAANGRLLSNHQKGTEAPNGIFGPNYLFDFWTATWLTHAVLQMANHDPSRQKGHDWANYAITQNWNHNKPVFNDEYGYDTGSIIPREIARKAAWGTAIAGGYGTYAEWHGTMPNVGSMAGLWRVYPSQDDINVLINFMKATDYRNMSQHNELVTLASGPAYMYAADGGSNSNFTVSLKAGSYNASWCSTTTGGVIKTETPFQLTGDGPKTFAAPNFSTDTDVVFKIKKSTSPVTPLSAVSRKTHGSGGTYDIQLPLTGPAGTECRAPGGSASHQVVITFSRTVTFTGASLTAGSGAVATKGSGTSIVTVDLSNVANAQRLVITLFNVNDGTTSNNVNIPMSVLAGDTDGNGVVNSSDITKTRSESGNTLAAANFRHDVTVSGSLNGADALFVKSKSGTALP
jgi:hypothetical protein